ncbi:unnamed protein product [Meloidogyne enterolobii]|uniref:Uncharacterized protein n=1 Tax=Meloidogyne enterolobii TaxID=390850 RepID=A0ACB0XKC9_MELEN
MDVSNAYRRLSFSPSTSTQNRAASRLTKEKIDEILQSPYETDYTYSYTYSYKPNGSREYIHPRLCRRFTSTPGQIEKQNIFLKILIML